MGRKSQSKELNLWLNGILVGKWCITSTGMHEFNYYNTWIESNYSRAISLSLPLRQENHRYKGVIVESFFENLLPDSLDIRKRLQTRFHTRSTGAFDLLYEVGRDCVGAIQILDPEISNVKVQTIMGKKVSDAEIEKILLSLTNINQNYHFDDEDFRISLAGAQEKTTFLYHDKKWKIPQKTTPSTHIFKLPIGPLQSVDMSTSVENEWLCSQIIKSFNVPIANVELGQFGNQKVLIVERFDRKFSDDNSWIIRIPQEDFCQVTGTSPGFKYESDGGPGIIKIMDILLGSEKSENDRKIFFKTQILFWLLAAPDGHGKNFSIFLEQNDRFYLTPLYDVISAYPAIGKSQNKIPVQRLKTAMAVYGKNKNYHWNKIKIHHWIQIGKKCGLNEKYVKEIFEEILDCYSTNIKNVANRIPDSFNEEVADSIFQGMENTIAKLNDRNK